MNVKTILFDLDGVLVDACEWHYLALNLALKDFNIEQISRKDHEEKFNGLPTKVKLKILNVDDDTALKINEIKQKYTFDIIRSQAKRMEEKIELHEYLKFKNIKIAVYRFRNVKIY